MKPDVLDKLAVDRTVDAYGDLLGVPSRPIVSTDKAAARQQRAEGATAADGIAGGPGDGRRRREARPRRLRRRQERPSGPGGPLTRRADMATAIYPTVPVAQPEAEAWPVDDHPRGI